MPGGPLFLLLIIIASLFSPLVGLSATEEIVALACEQGEPYKAFEKVRSLSDEDKSSNVNLLHVQSSLTFIFESDVENAIILHKLARAVDPKTPPILAILQQVHRRDCGGAGDIFYVAAVVLKQIVDTNASNPDILYNGHTTLVTLLADSGFHAAAETHLNASISLQPTDKSLLIRGSLMTPAVFRDNLQIISTRAILERRMYALSDFDTKIKSLDEFVLSPYYYFCYQGYNDKKLLSALQSAYVDGFPDIGRNLLNVDLLNTRGMNSKTDGSAISISGEEIEKINNRQRRIRVGFVSSHFRQHSICKLFCGIVSKLAERSKNHPSSSASSNLEIFVFSSLERGTDDNSTKRLRDSLEPDHYISVSNTIRDHFEVTTRSIDILVYLDIGMDPKTIVWAAARLAPIQLATWGHPSTTGIANMDFYLTSDSFHVNRINPSLIAHDDFSLAESVPYPAYFDIALGNRSKVEVEIDSISEVNCCSNLRSTIDSALTSFHSIEFINNNCHHHHHHHHRQKTTQDLNTCVFDRGSNIIMSESGRKGLMVLEQELFSEQLIRLDSLGFFFDRNIPTQVTKYAKSANIKLLDVIEVESLQFLSGKHAVSSEKNGVSVFEYPKAATSYLMSIRPRNGYYASLIDFLPRDTKSIVKEFLTLIASKSFSTLLIPQHLSKFHPIFDIAIRDILVAVPNSKIVILQPKNKLQWKLTLESRWRSSMGTDMVRDRIIWVPPLTPNEYLTLLALGDVMLDPFPFGGGVTTLEALSVCTPTVTAPALQTVPALATGMLTRIFEADEALRQIAVTNTVQDYVGSVKRLLSSSSSFPSSSSSSSLDGKYDLITRMRISICKSSHLVFNQSQSVYDWSTLLGNLL